MCVCHLGDELQDLGLCIWGGQHTQHLQSPEAAKDFPLFLLQGQVAVGNEGLVPLHLLWGAGIALRSSLHHPAMLSLLRAGEVGVRAVRENHGSTTQDDGSKRTWSSDMEALSTSLSVSPG